LTSEPPTFYYRKPIISRFYIISLSEFSRSNYTPLFCV